MPKRERDYAQERARRDAKYQALGYRNYNQYDKERRQRAKQYSQYSKEWRSLREKKIREKPRFDPSTIAAKVKQFYIDAGNDPENFGNPDDSAYWEAFRLAYDNR